MNGSTHEPEGDLGDSGLEDATTAAEDQAGSGTRSKPKRQLFPLGIPRPTPAKLEEFQALVQARIADVFENIWEIDQTIEALHPLLEDLMVQDKRRVGVEWRPHKTRPGRHPAVYRTRRASAHGVTVRLNRNGPSAGPDRAVATRFWVEHVHPPVGLGRLARAPSSVADAVRDEQRDALELLQELVRLRQGCMDILSTVLQRTAGWTRTHQHHVRPPAGEGPNSYRALVAEMLQRTTDLRLNLRAEKAWLKAQARTTIAANEIDDDARGADGT